MRTQYVQDFINDLESSQLSTIRRVKDWASWADQEARNRAQSSPEVGPSVYWALTSHIHSYMNDLPAQLFDGLRLHTYHLDGDTLRRAVNGYSGGGAIDSAPDLYILYAARLRSQIPERYRIGTPLPAASMAVLMDDPSPMGPAAYADGSIVMVPNFLLSKLEPFRFDLAINMDSLQEITESQVTAYLEILAPRTDLLYSKNIDEFDNTTDKVAATTVLQRYFDITPIAPWPTRPLSQYKYARKFASNIRRKLTTVTSGPQ